MTVRFESPSAFLVRDEFEQTAGALTGKTLPSGQTWGSALGDTDDFQVSGSGLLTRNTTGDTPSFGIGGGRAVAAGTTSYAAVGVQVDFMRDNVSAAGQMGQGLMLRWVDANNYLAVFIDTKAALQLWVYKYVAGVATPLVPGVTFAENSANTWRTLRVLADPSGRLHIWTFVKVGSYAPTPLRHLQDPVLATGGALASGKVGILDSHDSTGATTRTYNDFFAFAHVPDAALFA